MTVLIVTSFGATKNYPDKEMMKITLTGFLNSLRRQTDGNYMLFISCHDRPDFCGDDLRVVWSSLACDEGYDGGRTYTRPPGNLDDPGEYEDLPYDCKMTDMSRKTLNSTIEAARWAYRNGLKAFWMLRMDSDDLLARDHIAFLNSLNPNKTRAIYNRKCHIYDPREKEIGIYDYSSSTTCNALYMEFDGNRLPLWYYHNNDHTTFMRSVKKDGIPGNEVDWILCILTNSGNSISGRGRIEDTKEARVTKLSLSGDLIDRYGLDCLQ
jgi:hypothetical protein